MPRKVIGGTGQRNVALPGGWNLDAGDLVVVSDEEWDLILSDETIYLRIIDGGDTALLPTAPPTWRDIQWKTASADGVDQQYVDDTLSAHINSPTPHPAYDNIGDLVVLLENGMI